jgi:hypothetical protein
MWISFNLEIMTAVLVAQLLIVDRTTVYSAYYFNIENIAFVVSLVHNGLFRRKCSFFIVRCGAEEILFDTEFMLSGVS